MFYYLYKTTNTINGNIYIGVHATKNIADNYLGSGKVLKQAIEKYGAKNFTKDILEFADTWEAILEKEKTLVTPEFLLREDVYNLRIGGEGGWDYIVQNNLHKTGTNRVPWNKGKFFGPLSEEAKHKRSATLKKYWSTRTHHLKGTKGLGKGTTGIEPWNKGMEMPKSKCLYCEKMVDDKNKKRWHDDNCKQKPKS